MADADAETETEGEMSDRQRKKEVQRTDITPSMPFIRRCLRLWM